MLLIFMWAVSCSFVSAAKIAVSPAMIDMKVGHDEIVRVFNPNNKIEYVNHTLDGGCVYVKSHKSEVGAGKFEDLIVSGTRPGSCTLNFWFENSDNIHPSVAVKINVKDKADGCNKSKEEEYSGILRLYYEGIKDISVNKQFKGVMLIISIVIIGLLLWFLTDNRLSNKKYGTTKKRKV